MSIENLFAGLIGNEKTSLAGIRKDATSIGSMGNAIARIQKKSVLPNEISARQIIKSAEELGQLEGEVELAKDIADYRSKELDKLVQLHEVNTSFAQKVMSVDQKIRQIEASHGRGVTRYRLNAAEMQANLDGYQAAYQMSAEIFE